MIVKRCEVVLLAVSIWKKKLENDPTYLAEERGRIEEDKIPTSDSGFRKISPTIVLTSLEKIFYCFPIYAWTLVLKHMFLLKFYIIGSLLVSPNFTWGSKISPKCHRLFEWPLRAYQKSNHLATYISQL